MTVAKLRTCKNGHQFYKGSDCPTCPLCEEERKPSEGFLSLLVAPARRALESNGITTLEKLSKYSEAEVLGLHGVGPSTMPKLKELLREQGMKFRKID
jgi:predicted RecB family nuclease